jgi:hypothetical protein
MFCCWSLGWDADEQPEIPAILGQKTARKMKKSENSMGKPLVLMYCHFLSRNGMNRFLLRPGGMEIIGEFYSNDISESC